jgi:predicted acyl esterase
MIATFIKLRTSGEPAKPGSPLYKLVSHAFLVPMLDGVKLKTYHIEPTHNKEVLASKGKRLCLPVILIRSPYSRYIGSIFAHCFAQRGYHVIQQDCRGCFESEGEFDILASEKEDAQSTLKWLGQQGWCNGSVGCWGVSYDGYTAWTGLAASLESDQDDADPNSKPAAVVRAAVPIFTRHVLSPVVEPSLHTAL